MSVGGAIHSMRYPNPEMLVRIGCGDALAAATEYVEPEAPIVEKTLRFIRYESHPWHGHRPGRYTDDAEMSAANARVLIGDFERTELGFAGAYLAEFERGGKREGYSRGTRALLESVNGDPHSLLHRLKSINPKTRQAYNRSKKNGAAMRSVPFGVLPDVGEMLDLVSLQAAVTHDSLEGLFSARAVALMSHYALYEPGSLEQMGDWCVGHLPHGDQAFRELLTTSWQGGAVTSRRDIPVSLTTVWAVSDLLREGPSLMEIMRRLITWGGDTDSVAAIAWGIASARYRDEVLPAFLENDLELGDPRTGAPYLRELGTKLMTRDIPGHRAAGSAAAGDPAEGDL